MSLLDFSLLTRCLFAPSIFICKDSPLFFYVNDLAEIGMVNLLHPIPGSHVKPHVMGSASGPLTPHR